MQAHSTAMSSTRYETAPSNRQLGVNATFSVSLTQDAVRRSADTRKPPPDASVSLKQNGSEMKKT